MKNKDITLSEDYLKEHKEATTLEYDKPRLIKRVTGIVIDFAIALVFACAIGIGAFYIFTNASFYQEAIATENNVKAESGLYDKDNDYALLCDSLKNDDTKGYQEKNLILDTSLTSFYTNPSFFDDNSGMKIYNEAKASEVVDDVAIFSPVYEGSVIVSYEENGKCTNERYFEFYSYHMGNRAIGYLANNDAYLNSSRVVFWTTAGYLIGSYLLGIIIAFLIPPLTFFRRGRLTIGKKFMKIGLIGLNALNISYKRFLVRFAIFFLVEVVLSFLTFLVPILVSITMLYFSKYQMSLHDYFTNIYIVSTEFQNIYFDKDDYDKRNGNNKEVSIKNVGFHLTRRD